MTVLRPLIYVVISGVLYVDRIRGVRASVAESPRALAALLVGGDGNDMVGQASNLNQNKHRRNAEGARCEVCSS